MAKSLPPVSAKVIADAEQFINEFKRADNAARRSAANIDREVGTLTKKIGDKFKLADFGKDVLKGAGLFGGFDIARTASEAIAGWWEKAAESAKAIEASTEKSLAATMKTIAARQTDAQKEAQLRADFDRAGRQLADASAQKTQRVPLYRLGMQVGTQNAPRVTTDAEIEEINRLDAAYKTLGAQLEELERKKRDTTATAAQTASISDQDRKIKALNGGLADQEKAFDALLSKQSKATEETAKLREESAKLAEKYREISDPTLRFTKQMAEANALAAEGKITFAEAARAVDELKRAMEDDREARVNKSLKDFFGDLDEQEKSLRQVEKNSLEIERIVGRAADGMADAWVDSLKGVEGAWGNLADTIITEILRVAAQILIVKPLINGLGGILSGFGAGGGILDTLGTAFSGYGGGKASGGGVEGGYTYRVNENGQEFFRPNVGGTIIPVGASSGHRGEGGGSVTINQSYQIGAGVTAAQLLPILAMQKRDLLATLADAKRRRSSMGAALA